MGKRSRELAQNAALALGSTLVALLLLEAAARRLPGADVLLVRPSPVPGLAYGFVPGQTAVVQGERIRINAQGFREDRDVPREKPAGSFRVVALGDSVVFGQGSGGREFATQLEELLRPAGVEVVNTGVPSYSTCQELTYLRSVLKDWSPDAVIVGYAANDPEGPRTPFGLELATGRIAPWWRAYHWVKQRLTVVKLAVKLASPAIVRLRGHAHYGPPVDQKDFVRYIEALHDPKGPHWPAAAACLDGFGLWSRETGVPVLVAILPLFDKWDSPELRRVYARVASRARAAGVEALDLRRALDGTPADVVARVKGDGLHPTAEGHGLIARELAPFVRKAQARRDQRPIERR